MNADGTAQTNLTNHPAQDREPDWTGPPPPPPSGRIAFMTDRGSGGNYEVFVINEDGSGQTNLTNNAALDLNPDWAPDGLRNRVRHPARLEACTPGDLRHELRWKRPDQPDRQLAGRLRPGMVARRREDRLLRRRPLFARHLRHERRRQRSDERDQRRSVRRRAVVVTEPLENRVRQKSFRSGGPGRHLGHECRRERSDGCDKQHRAGGRSRVVARRHEDRIFGASSARTRRSS